MIFIIIFCASALAFAVLQVILTIRLTRRAKQSARKHKPKPITQSTVFPEEKLSFNDWSKYIHNY